jgi:hypothetical protein
MNAILMRNNLSKILECSVQLRYPLSVKIANDELLFLRVFKEDLVLRGLWVCFDFVSYIIRGFLPNPF